MTNVQHIHYSSRQELVQWFNDCPTKDNSAHWTNSRSRKDVLAGVQVLTHGSTNSEHIAMIECIQSETFQSIATPQRSWQLETFGAFPNVEAYLSGEPENMWYLAPDLSERAPIHIYFSVSASWSIPYEHIAKRGAALAALASVLSQTRQVLLTPFVELSSHNKKHQVVISWDMQSSPMVMSEIATILDGNVTRMFGLTACQAVDKLADPNWVFDPTDEIESSETFIKAALSASDDDIVFCGLHLHDPFLVNPTAHVKALIEKYTNTPEG